MKTLTLRTLKSRYANKLDKSYRLEADSETLIARLYRPTPKAKYSKEKCLFAYKFETEKSMLDYLNNNYNERVSIIEYRTEQKNKRKELVKKQSNNVNVGDIFCDSWGYEQTNVDFYQVIEKPSPATIVVREISCESIEDVSWASDYVRPVKDSFLKNSEPIKKRLNGDYFKTSSFSSASKVDDPLNSKHYRSWYA